MRVSWRYLTAGESHGPALVGILEGMPRGVGVGQERLDAELGRRQAGYGRGGRQQIETDHAEVLAGIRFGRTLGTPVAIVVRNLDFAHWTDRMAPFGPESGEPVRGPRPGHADLAGGLKFGVDDLRDVLERSSARETAMRVALGALAKILLEQFGVRIRSRVLSIGGVWAETLEEAPDWTAVENSPVRTDDSEAAERMMRAIDEARRSGDSLGGVFEVVAEGVPPGLGSYTQPGDRLDGRLAGALLSIPAIKGAEVGLGFRAAEAPGSMVHDEILFAPGRGYQRPTNRAGGIEGGISNGEPIRLRAAMKPIPTLYKPLRSVDWRSHEQYPASVERSDTTAVPAAAVVAEAMVALELAGVFREKFGGDSLAEMRRNFDGYLAGLPR